MHSIFEKNKVAIDFTDTHREKSLTPKSHCYAVIINGEWALPHGNTHSWYLHLSLMLSSYHDFFYL